MQLLENAPSILFPGIIIFKIFLFSMNYNPPPFKLWSLKAIPLDFFGIRKLKALYKQQNKLLILKWNSLSSYFVFRRRTQLLRRNMIMSLLLPSSHHCWLQLLRPGNLLLHLWTQTGSHSLIQKLTIYQS